MIRNFKAVGLALVAMLALGAFAAQGATALPLTSESATTFYTGEQEGPLEFKTNHGVVKCTEASYTATTTSKEVNELTVAPTWPTEKKAGGNNCSAFGFANTHVNANGCTFTFTTPTKLAAGEPTWGKEQLHLLCPAGKAIEVTPTSGGVSVCTLFVGAQTPAEGHVVGTNKGLTGSGMDVTLDVTLAGLVYTGSQANNAGPCTNSSSHTEATFTGSVTVKCFSDEKHEFQTGCTFS